jgi:chorismate mutase
LTTGKFVSESKFRSDPAAFIPRIENPNPTALEALIAKPAVERALLMRLGKKASIYGPEIELSNGAANGDAGDDNNHSRKWKIDIESVRELYESWIIPLTKEVEVSRGLFFISFSFF